MTKIIALCAVCCLLVSCSGFQERFELPTLAPRATDPRICAEPPEEPVLPDGAGVVQPLTQQEAEALGLWLDWNEAMVAHSRRGWEIVSVARERCGA